MERVVVEMDCTLDSWNASLTPKSCRFGRPRTQPGDFRIGGNSVVKIIDHNKLRLKYQRRNCPDRTKTECMEPDPPMADFPNGWSGETDTLHVDFKVPSEHTIEGQRYDAEMQVFNLHVDRRRTPVQAALIRATETGFNYYFEEVLKVFETQYQYDWQQCNLKRQQQQSNRKMTESSGIPASTHGDVDEKSNELDKDRDLQIGVWDPFHSMLIPSIYFWRYDGSLTEPPCGEFVSWFVCDVPMEISLDQLERMKKVLFTHVDVNCKPTSTQFDHSVARPLQDRAGRPVWRCKTSDFVADPSGMYPGVN
jgi:carbonic anhydrase